MCLVERDVPVTKEYNDFLGDAKMAAKTKPTKTKRPTKKIDVPAVRPTKNEPKSAIDLLSMVSGAAPVKKKKAATDRPTLELTPEAEGLYAQFIPSKQIFDIFDSHLKILKADLKSEVFRLWADKMFAQKAKPVNPKLALNNGEGKPDMSGVFIIQAKFKVHATTAEEAQEMLVAVGLSEEDAENLVTAEIDFTPMSALRSFNELVKGHKVEGGWADATEQEQSIAQKLMTFVMGQKTEPITEEERAVVLVNQPSIQVKHGFLDRVANYCKTAEQLHGVFTVITPVAYAKGGKFGISDTTDEIRTRLVTMAAEILGESLN
jgi:hypothetical protein